MAFVSNPSRGAPVEEDPVDRAARVLGRVSRGLADTVKAGGRVVAPGAGIAIATTGNLVNAGVYEIWGEVSVGAGGLAADAGNMQLQEGATVLAIIAVPAPGAIEFGPIRRTAAAADALTVNAVGVATAAVPYSATIFATQLE